MKKIAVHLKKKVDDTYDISYSTSFIKELIVDLKTNDWANKYAIITDSKVKKIYGDELLNKLKRARIDAEIISFPQGEKNKTLFQADKLLQKLSKLEFHRDGCVIALGGGVTGDLASFVASIYMRGIPYIQIPTTLLSMVDSSVGGKTGVDTKWGKNLVGTFYQPKKVYIDPSFLKTLPPKQFSNGIAEIIKYAVIAKPSLLRTLKKHHGKIINCDKKILQKIIMQCINIKAAFVMKDEKEEDIRRFLNYGHTIGHAIEKISNYSIQHGEAVSLGMSIINTIAVQKKWLLKKHQNLVKEIIKLYDLPTKFTKNIDLLKLISATKLDKKVEKGKINYIVPSKIGKVFFTDKISSRDIIKACKKHT